MTTATPKLRRRFERWVTKNGGRVLPRAANEFVRFTVVGQLCIVYEKKGALSSMVGDETAPCWAAFEAGEPLDLRTDEIGQGVTESQGRKAVALAVSDIRSGRSEPMSIRAICRSTGLAVRTVAKVARANGAQVCGMKLGRAGR